MTVIPSLRELWREDAAPEDASSCQQLEQVEQRHMCWSSVNHLKAFQFSIQMEWNYGKIGWVWVHALCL